MTEPNPSPAVLRDLIERVRAAEEVDGLLAAHLTATFLAPAGSFVTVAPISGEIRVCTDKRTYGGDLIWCDWAAWRARWTVGTLDAAFGLLEHTLTGANFIYGRGRLSRNEPPYGCQLLFAADEVLGQAEHEDGPCAVVLAILTAKLALTQGAEHAPE